MSAQITEISNRRAIAADYEEQAQIYLREFDPKRYSGYYARIYDADAYFGQVGIEKICELIEHGGNLLQIAKRLDISTRTLRHWVNKDHWRKKQVQEAYRYAGDAFAFKAEDVLRCAIGGDKDDIAIAKALADHYRWMATKLDKEQYGEVRKEDANASKAPLVFNVSIGASANEEQVRTVRAPLEGAARVLGVTLSEKE